MQLDLNERQQRIYILLNAIAPKLHSIGWTLAFQAGFLPIDVWQGAAYLKSITNGLCPNSDGKVCSWPSPLRNSELSDNREPLKYAGAFKNYLQWITLGKSTLHCLSITLGVTHCRPGMDDAAIISRTNRKNLLNFSNLFSSSLIVISV